MRVLIADDEAPARFKLRRLLESAADVELVGEASTGRAAVAAIRRTAPDLVFLDIQMPGLDGFGVVQAIAGPNAPYVVFVTAFDDHAIRAFDVGAVDYLLKPFPPDRFQRVLERARAQLPRTELRQSADPPAPLSRILVQHQGRAAFLAVDRIDWIESDRNYVHFVSGGRRFRARGTLNAVAARLDGSAFLRLNRSTLVRLDSVREMQETSHGDYRVTLHDGTTLVWSRRYRAAAEKTFGIRQSPPAPARPA